MKFQEEKIKDSIEEAKPLLRKHWEEIAFYKDIELNPDYELYFRMEAMGATRAYAARDDQGKMIGYAVYFLRYNPHYKQSFMAVEDIIFFDPAARGRGALFIKWCDDQLKALGVQIVSHHVKVFFNWGRILERMGYDKQDIIYTKRLDREA
jgi:GNAT superfamily N-acetyltransferase